MSIENKHITQLEFETIERYLVNTMTETERLAFEKQLETDKVLQQHVTEQKLFFNAIETQTLKEKINHFHEENEAIQLKNNATYKRSQFIKYAAAAVLIIAAGSFLFLNDSTNEKLYTKYFAPDPGLATTMSSTANFEFYDAMVNYKQGDYKTAISKWEVLQQNKPKNDTLNYFLGVTHLANKNENSAISYLDFVTKTSNSTFKNEAFYYLGLAYLKANNIKLAKKNLTFSTIEKSKTLLSELND